MRKMEVTIAIPSIKTLEECKIIESFVKSGCSDRLFVQFVFLHNPKIVENLPSRRESYFTYELLFVGSPVFILSCEENFFRLQDFTDLLKPMLMIVGEHDIIHWERLIEALAFAEAQKLDAVGLTFLSTQHHLSGAISQLASTPELDDPDFHANHYTRAMIQGQSLDSRIAFPAWLSYYGTIYAICYIGNHLYSRETFSMLMQYRFTEPMHSFVYMQAAFFSQHHRRYGYFNHAVVERTGNEMELGHKGHNIDEGFQLSRTLFGNTKVQQIVHVAHLNQIENDALFHVLVNSVGITMHYVEPDRQEWGRHYMLSEILQWCMDTLKAGISARSYYFPDLCRQSSQRDMRHSYQLLSRMVKGFVQYPQIYKELTEGTKIVLIETVIVLGQYLNSAHVDAPALTHIHNQLYKAFTSITYKMVLDMNKASFLAYAHSLKTVIENPALVQTEAA